MTHRLKGACIALVAAVALVACSVPAPTAARTDAQSFAAKAEGGLFMTGSLAALGSFEWDLAPLYTRNAVMRHNTAVALNRNEITVDEAQSVLDQTDAVRALLDQARSACEQNDVTGKCRGSQMHARALLSQAKAALAVIH